MIPLRIKLVKRPDGEVAFGKLFTKPAVEAVPTAARRGATTLRVPVADMPDLSPTFPPRRDVIRASHHPSPSGSCGAAPDAAHGARGVA